MPANDPVAAGEGRNPIAGAFRGLEHAFDALFGADANPLRQLGALGYFFFWIVVASGIYVYIFFDTSVPGAWRSVEALSREQWYAGGVMRSLHRYASDGFVAVMLLHLAREAAHGRFSGFRWYHWVSGVPLLWFAFASGVVGYWLVWDRLAQFVAQTTMEWCAALPGFDESMIRNVLGTDTLSDRLFSLLVFLHIGVPLILLAGMWVHIHRVTGARSRPHPRLGWGTAAALLALSFVKPALSLPEADLATEPAVLELDWFYLAPYPLVFRWSAQAVWILLGGATLFLIALPWLRRGPRPPVAKVDPANCNGCGRCFADCPYGAVTLVPREGRRAREKLAVVIGDQCASCGICAGACPSSTPFRSVDALQTGIDLPQYPIGEARARLDRALERLGGEARVVLFGCDRGANVGTLRQPGVEPISLLCLGMLPPSFVEYALRAGADGVMVAGCREGDCEFRFGPRWTGERLAARREPHLRNTVPRERLRFLGAGPGESEKLEQALAAFRSALAELRPPSARPAPPRRRSGVVHA